MEFICKEAQILLGQPLESLFATNGLTQMKAKNTTWRLLKGKGLFLFELNIHDKIYDETKFSYSSWSGSKNIEIWFGLALIELLKR